MHSVKGHALILAAGAVGACVSFEVLHALHPARVTNVAAVAPRAPSHEASALKPLPASTAQSHYTRVLLSPSDHETLARDIQRELQRVGCYRSEIDGNWGPQSRQAMGAFTINLKLRIPFDTPDEMLLRLVQGQTQRVCGGPDLDPEQAASSPSAVPPPRLVQPPMEVKRSARRALASDQRPPQEPSPDMRRAERVPVGPPPAPSPTIVRTLMQTVAGVLGPLGF